MDVTRGNDLTIYDLSLAAGGAVEVRWLRVLRNMAPGRLRWFDRHIDWRGKRVLDLGCAAVSWRGDGGSRRPGHRD